MRQLFFINLFLLIFSFSPIYAQTDLSQQFMIEGLKKYLNGDTDSAINLLKKSLEENPKNQKAKNALLNIYVFLGKKYYKEKIYKSSKYNFKKALELDKNNKDAKEYLLKLKKIEERVGKLKNYKKKEDIGNEKSKIEQELEQKQATNKQYVSPEKRTSENTQTQPQSQKIIIQMKNQGTSDQESLDEFLSALKDIREKGTKENKEVLEKFEKMQKEKEKVQEEKHKIEIASKTKNYIFIIVIIILIVAVILTITFLILRFYRLRVRMAEHTYKFTAEREAKILEVMNNVVNIEKKEDALRLENKPDNTFLLSENKDGENQNNQNIINVPVDKIENSENMDLHQIYTLSEIEKGLTSGNIQKIPACLTAYYFADKAKMLENYIYFLDEYKNNESNFTWLMEVCHAVKDVDVFSHIVSKLSSFDKLSTDLKEKFKDLYIKYKSLSLLDNEEDLINSSEEILKKQSVSDNMSGNNSQTDDNSQQENSGNSQNDNSEIIDAETITDNNESTGKDDNNNIT